jgi:hypothetical protein
MCAAITPDSVTEESATLAASLAPLRAGAEADGRAEVGTREAQHKRKHRLISEPRADEVEVDERARQRTWIGYLYGSARLLFQMPPRGSTRDYITPSGGGAPGPWISSRPRPPPPLLTLFCAAPRWKKLEAIGRRFGWLKTRWGPALN